MELPQSDELSVEFERWDAQAPPIGFSEKMAERALAERSPIPVWERQWVRALLLAALLMSAGAAAAVGYELRERAALNVPTRQPESAPLKSVHVQVHLPSGSGVAERELGLPREVSRPVSQPPSEGQANESVESTAPAPRRLHLPRCECGTSAIVCTCSE